MGATIDQIMSRPDIAGEVRKSVAAEREACMVRDDELRCMWAILETLDRDSITIPQSVMVRAQPNISWRTDLTTGDLIIERKPE